MRPIDADELMRKYCGACDLDEMFCPQCKYHEFRVCIKNAPTIEPEVRRGRWIEETEPDENGNVISMCNQCYHTDEHGKNIIIRYCWYCGARMDADHISDGSKMVGGYDNDAV